MEIKNVVDKIIELHPYKEINNKVYISGQLMEDFENGFIEDCLNNVERDYYIKRIEIEMLLTSFVTEEIFEYKNKLLLKLEQLNIQDEVKLLFRGLLG